MRAPCVRILCVYACIVHWEGTRSAVPVHTEVDSDDGCG